MCFKVKLLGEIKVIRPLYPLMILNVILLYRLARILPRRLIYDDVSLMLVQLLYFFTSSMIFANIKNSPNNE